MRYLIATFFALLATTFLIAQPTSVNLDFSKSGKALVNFYEQTNDSYNAVAISVTGDNQVLLAGDVYYEAVVHKIKSTGKDDMTFGSKGFRFFDFGLAGNNRIEEILNYPGAKTILIGHATPCLSSVNKYSSNSGATVIRLLANGQPDTSFGIKGKAFYLRHDLSLWAFTGLVQPDGKIVVACRGNGNIKTTAIWDKIMLIRFTASGVLDTTFGKSGFFILPQYNGCKNVLYCGKSGMALQPDGNILLGDITTEMILGNGSKSSPAVYRVTPQGKLDKTFGVNGVFVNRLGHHNYAINSVVVQPDGKIVVAGNTLSAQQTTTWLMFRLKSNGQIDSSFAQNGLFTYSGDGWTQGTIGDIAMAGNDRIIASAVHATSAGGVIDAFRLKLNGTFDSSFAQSTVIFQKTMQAGYFLSCAKMSIDTNHDLAILGYTSNFPFQNPSNIGHMVLRLSKDGIPIREFNTSGSRQYYNTQNIATTTDYNYGSTDKLTGIAQFKNGKILLAGNIFRNNETQKEIGLTRLDVKGETDSTFGIHGRVKLFPGHSQDRTKVFFEAG